MYPFFPNPFINNIYGNFQAQQAGSLEIIGVDEDYEVLVEKQIIEVDSGYNSIQLNLSELASGTTFRFFYKFYFDNCELQGYGDAQKQ